MNIPAKLSTFEKFKQSGYLDDVPDDIAPKLVKVIVSQASSFIEQEFVKDYQTALAKAIMIRLPTEIVEVFECPAGITKNNEAKVVYTNRYFVGRFTKEEIMKKDLALIETRAAECVLFLFDMMLKSNYTTMYIYTLCGLQPIDMVEDSYMSTFRAVFE